MTYAVLQAFPSSPTAILGDSLRLLCAVAAALVAGLLIWEIRLRWHDRSARYVLVAAVVFGAPMVASELASFGERPTPRLMFVVFGLGFTAAGLIRVRKVRRRVVAAMREETKPAPIVAVGYRASESMYRGHATTPAARRSRPLSERTTAHHVATPRRYA